MHFSIKNLLLDTYGSDHIFINTIVNSALFRTNEIHTDYWQDVKERSHFSEPPKNFRTQKNIYLDTLYKWYFPTNDVLCHTIIDLFVIATELCDAQFRSELEKHIGERMKQLSLYQPDTSVRIEAAKDLLSHTLNEQNQTLFELYGLHPAQDVFETFLNVFREYHRKIKESKGGEYLSNLTWDALSNSDILKLTVKSCQEVMMMVIVTGFDVSTYKLFSARSNINPFTLCDFGTGDRLETLSLGSGLSNDRFWTNKAVLKFKENFTKNKDRLKPGQFKFQDIQQMFFYSGYLQQTAIGVVRLVREFRQECISTGGLVKEIDKYIAKVAIQRLPFFDANKFEVSEIPRTNWDIIMAAVNDPTEYDMQLKGERDYAAFSVESYRRPFEKESNSGWILVGTGAAALGILALSLR